MDKTFELVEEDVPDIGDGEALVRTEWISLDPTNRTWIGETPTYLPPVGIGEVMRAAGLGRVVASKNEHYPEGSLVQGLTGWQEYVVASESAPLLPVIEVEGVAPSAYLGVLGMTGLTAFVGIDRDLQAAGGGDLRGLRRRGRRRLRGRAAGEGARRSRGRHRRRAREDGPAQGAARVRRDGGLQGGRLARPAEGGHARTASTWTSRTWAERSWTPSSPGSTSAPAWLCAASSPATTRTTRPRGRAPSGGSWSTACS